MACIQTYSPSEVSLVIALIYEATEFAPDSIISIRRDDGYFSTTVGANGDVERTQVSNDLHTLEVTLSQTSPTNTVLSALATLDARTRSAAFPIFAKDSSGQSLFLASSCWIESPPVASYTSTIETRTWVIKCAEMTFGIAGNAADRRVLENVGQLSSLIGQFGGNLGLF